MCLIDVHVLPVAVLTGVDGGARLVDVDEVDGVLVERGTGVEIELVDLLTVIGLPDLQPAA